MSSILKTTAVLSISRLLNRLITMLTPLLLVRILDIEQFGQYREFLLYSMLLANVVVFGANRSLMYFVPKNPERESSYLTQSVAITGTLTVACVFIMWLVRDWFATIASFDFLVPLILFSVVYANLDYVEMYCVAKKRPELVLIYGAARLVLRIVVLVAVAYFTRDISVIVYSIVATEAVRFAVVLAVSVKLKLLSIAAFRRDLLVEQWRFTWPLGLSSVLIDFAERATNIFVTTLMGPAALALYSVGAYQRPIVGVLRGAVADAIFPDMVSRAEAKKKRPLSLWQRSTVGYYLLMLPTAVLLVVHAELIITLLFTNKFIDAVPVFQIYSISLILFCFEFDLPVRALGITKYFLRISAIGLVIKIAFIWIAFKGLGFVGPAIAAVATHLITISYLAKKCLLVTTERLADILPWGQFLKITLAAAIGIPVLLLDGFAYPTGLLGAGISSLIYVGLYVAACQLAGISEFRTLAARVLQFVVKD